MLACAAVLALPGAGSAQAAFRGHDGLLVVSPVRGPGLLLVGARGRIVRSACSSTALCGTASGARFSPNGRAIVFSDAGSTRLELISPDGVCLWCLPGPGRFAAVGQRPAFLPGGGSISWIGGGGVWRAALGGGPPRLVTAGAFSDAVWSSTGLLAAVAHGRIWVGRSGGRPLRAVARGSSPSFSPGGRAIAFVRHGWIWIVRVAGGRARRLVRGASPAFAPDGRSIAFIGAGNHLTVVPVAGGPARRLGSVRGSSVDWQAVAPRATPCTTPRGAHVLGSNSEAVVSVRDGNVYGCLRALGAQHLLASFDPFVTSIGQVALAGRFAAVSFSEEFHAACDNWLEVHDVASGAKTGTFDAGCSDSIGSLALDSSGFAAWRVITPPGNTNSPFVDVACPQASSCQAVDLFGTVAAATTPTAGRGGWRLAQIDQRTFGLIVCPAANACFASDDGGNLLSSTHPGGGPAAWSSAHIDNAVVTLNGGFPASLISLACPSGSMCVGLDDAGNVLTSTDPSGGASRWNSAKVSTQSFFDARPDRLACPTTSECVAIDNAGNLLTSADPTGGAGAWTHTALGHTLEAVSCPSASLCVVVDDSGDVLTSANPTGGAGAWKLAHVSNAFPADRGELIGITCPSASLCVAFDYAGGFLTSTNPQGGQGAWKLARLVPLTAPEEELAAVSCPTSTLCVAVNGQGYVLTSSNPAGGASAWKPTAVDGPSCWPATPCLAETMYASDDAGTRVIDSAPPGNGKALVMRLSGNSLVLRWTHAGSPHELAVR